MYKAQRRTRQMQKTKTIAIACEMTFQLVSVLAYLLLLPIASAPSVAYVVITLATVLPPTARCAKTLHACNRLLLLSTGRVACSLSLYVLLGLFNLHDTF